MRAKSFLFVLLAILTTFALPEASDGVMQPRMGRFLQRDPVGYPDGMNSYAAHHVLRGGVDPSGGELVQRVLDSLMGEDMSVFNGAAQYVSRSAVDALSGFSGGDATDSLLRGGFSKKITHDVEAFQGHGFSTPEAIFRSFFNYFSTHDETVEIVTGTCQQADRYGEELTWEERVESGLSILVQAAETWAGVKVGGGGKPLRRPYIRRSTRAVIEAKAPRTVDGRPIDPNTLKAIEGKPDVGHKTGHEFWRERVKAEGEGLDQKQFNDRMNNPDLYQLEDLHSNRGHKYELPKQVQHE